MDMGIKMDQPRPRGAGSWNRRLGGLIVMLVALITLTAVSAADGRPFRLVVPRVAAFGSDGTRYVAWQVSDGSPIVVLDTQTGKRVGYAGCSLFGEAEGSSPVAAEGRFLVTCKDGTAVLSAASGATVVLPDPKGPLGGEWKTIGKRFVEGSADPHDCNHSAREVKEESRYEGGPACIAVYDLGAASISYRPGSQIPDLDHAGAPPVCRALRSRYRADREGASFDRVAYRDGVLAESVRRGDGAGKRIRLTGCGHHTKLLATAPEPENLVLAGGLLSWDTGHQAAVDHEGEDIRTGRLWTFRLASGRRRSLPLPLVTTLTPFGKMRGALGYSSHAGRTLFWIAATRLVQEGEKGGPTLAASAVYAAKL